MKFNNIVLKRIFWIINKKKKCLFCENKNDKKKPNKELLKTFDNIKTIIPVKNIKFLLNK